MTDRRPAQEPDAQRSVAVDVPLDLRRTLGIHGRGAADPTLRFEVSGSTWRASRTPDGPVTLLVELRAGSAQARAWGPGAAWALARLEAFLGLDDDPARSFRSTMRSRRRYGGCAVCGSGDPAR